MTSLADILWNGSVNHRLKQFLLSFLALSTCTHARVLTRTYTHTHRDIHINSHAPYFIPVVSALWLAALKTLSTGSARLTQGSPGALCPSTLPHSTHSFACLSMACEEKISHHPKLLPETLKLTLGSMKMSKTNSKDFTSSGWTLQLSTNRNILSFSVKLKFLIFHCMYKRDPIKAEIEFSRILQQR